MSEGPRLDPPAYSIRSFCAAHEISRAHYYELQRQGLGPVAFRVGRKVLISGEAAREWRRRMETRTVEGGDRSSTNGGR